jgi:Fe-S cluster assembly iron-binding protein IscA
MITVTDVALEKIQGILAEEPEGTVIRVNVSPG